MNGKFLPSSGDPFRWTGNIYAMLALVLMVAVLFDWITGWTAYCWVRLKVAELAYLYGATIGATALIAVVFQRFKLAAALLLPGFFPLAWSIVERETGAMPVCLYTFG